MPQRIHQTKQVILTDITVAVHIKQVEREHLQILHMLLIVVHGAKLVEIVGQVEVELPELLTMLCPVEECVHLGGQTNRVAGFQVHQ